MAISQSVRLAVRRAWPRRRERAMLATDRVLATHAVAPLDDEPLSDHERRVLATWHVTPRPTVTATEAERRRLGGDDAGPGSAWYDRPLDITPLPRTGEGVGR